MNVVILDGRLTRDAVIRTTQGANPTTVANFTLAVNRNRKAADGEPNADFPRCIAFGRTAEFIEKYTKQGTKLIVRGRLQTGSYKDKDGKTVYTTDVIVEQVEFGESKNASAGNAANNTAPAETAQPEAPEDEFMNMDDFSGLDEELPFN